MWRNAHVRFLPRPFGRTAAADNGPANGCGQKNGLERDLKRDSGRTQCAHILARAPYIRSAAQKLAKHTSNDLAGWSDHYTRINANHNIISICASAASEKKVSKPVANNCVHCFAVFRSFCVCVCVCVRRRCCCRRDMHMMDEPASPAPPPQPSLRTAHMLSNRNRKSRGLRKHKIRPPASHLHTAQHEYAHSQSAITGRETESLQSATLVIGN